MNTLVKKFSFDYLYLGPSLLMMLLFAFIPSIQTIFMSFRKISLIFRSNEFIGFENYVNMMRDPMFWNSIKNTVVITTSSVFFEGVLGVLIALLIHKNFKWRGVVRAIVLIPWAIPTVVTSLMWKWFFNYDYGIINRILIWSKVVPEPISWLGDGNLATIAIIYAEVWKTTPFIALLVLAGLQNIPENLYEASSIDGANNIQKFFSITFPLVSKIFILALLLRTLDAFRIFDLVFVLTNGGPADSTEVISSYAYKVLFNNTNFGYGSALATSVVLSVGIISCIFLIIIKKIDKRFF